MVALLLRPMLYGGLYLYANHDPYGRLDKVPTAVVVEDAGTTLSTGEKLSVGPQVADELVNSKSFDWHRVDRAEATAGVSDGQVRVRPGTAEDVLRGPRVECRVRAAAGESRAAHQRRQQLPRAHHRQPGRRPGDQVGRRAGERDRGEQAAGRVQHDPRRRSAKAATGAGQLQSGLTSAATGVAKLQTGAAQLNTAQKQLSAGATKLAHRSHARRLKGAGDLATGAGQLISGLGTLKTKTATLARADQIAGRPAPIKLPTATRRSPASGSRSRPRPARW